MSKTNTIYSYAELMNDRINFRKVDYTGANRYDTPSALFFKLVFYFSDPNGLLALDGLDLASENNREQSIASIKAPYSNPESDKKAGKKPYAAMGNTALNYLLLNDELERANYLKQFIILLSSINADSPWYFREISGLDAALERKVFSEGELKIEDKPRQFTIKCLNDAQDDRIGSLLDLYRAICFSYQMKREVVPANLRKFNMGILIFSAPIRGKGGKSGDANNKFGIPVGQSQDTYFPSLKLVEFRNCEFDYNSSKSAWGTMNGDEPMSPEYTIGINYDDAYEVRYNEYMQKVITDFISVDIEKTVTGARNADINVGTKIPYDDTAGLKIDVKADPNTAKAYWTNTNDITDSNNNPYNVSVVSGDGLGSESNVDKKSMLGNVLTSQINGAANKLKELTALPSLKKNDNIHDYGTVSAIGKYEYLNRMSGTGGLVGGLASQAAGMGVKAATDALNRLILGNIYSMSVADIFSSASKALSGNVTGIVGEETRKNKKRELGVEDKKEIAGYKDPKEEKQKAKGVLAQYQQERSTFLGKYNEGKSIYNSL